MENSKYLDEIGIKTVWQGKSGQKYTLIGHTILDSSMWKDVLFICNISLIYKLPRFANTGTALDDFYKLRGKYKRDGFWIEVTPGGWADKKCQTYEMMVSLASVKIPKN